MAEKASCGNEDEEYPTARQQSRTSNAVRSEVINHSKTSAFENVLESLQTCHWQENYQVRQRKMNLLNDSRRKEKIRGLQAVLQEMLLEEPFDGPNPRKVGFITFNDAFELYLGFQSVHNFSDQERYNFQCTLLHPQTGLSVIIFTPPYLKEKIIALRSDRGLNFTKMFDYICEHMTDSRQEEFTKAEIDLILESMSSEWDREMIKYILCRTRTANTMESLGIRRETTQKIKLHMPLVLDAVRNSKFAGADIVQVRLNKRMDHIRSEIQKNEELLIKRFESWSKLRLE